MIVEKNEVIVEVAVTFWILKNILLDCLNVGWILILEREVVVESLDRDCEHELTYKVVLR